MWSFQLLGFPVVVEPWFWLVTVMLGAQRPPVLILPWVVAVFISILVHELGHAYMGRAYGLSAGIRLYSFGGLTAFGGGRRSLSILQEILISLAGPMMGFAFGLFVYLLARALPLGGSLFVNALISDLLWVNIAWGVVNLLPVLPLDGGHVMQQVLYWWTGTRDDTIALRISIGVAILMAFAALAYEMFWMAGLFGFMAYDNYQSLQRRPPWRVYGGRR
jgi:Zn-dependent protease